MNRITTFDFFVEKSILYTKITLSKKNVVLNKLHVFYFRSFNNVTDTDQRILWPICTINKVHNTHPIKSVTKPQFFNYNGY